MSIEEIACSKSYSEVIREERNFAAILYAALCRKGNIERFIKMLNHNCKFNLKVGDNPGVYFEYAFLRDWWHQILPAKDSKDEQKREKANKQKLKIIAKHLDIKNKDEIFKKNPKDFNAHFGVAGKGSEKHIQYPGTWSIKYLKKYFKDEKELKRVVKFKWACNVKPDIVIRVDDNESHYICIETKYESREGVYSLDVGNKRLTQRQTEIQKYLMEDLLGYKTEYVFIYKSGNVPEGYCPIKWAQAFEELDMENIIDDVNRIIDTCTKESAKRS